MNNPNLTPVSYSDLSDTRHTWRKAGIKGKITVIGGNTYRLNVGGEKGRVVRNGTRLLLVIHPVNSPAFYAALALLLGVLGETLHVEHTALTQAVTVNMAGGGTQTSFPVDRVLVGGQMPEPYAGNYAREHLTPPIGLADFFART